MKQIISIFAVAALGSGVAFAQPGQMGGQQGIDPQDQKVATDAESEYSPRVNYFKVKDFDALATQRTQEVKDIVGLNDKEFKKVEAWMKKDIKFRYKIQKLEDPDAAKKAGDDEEEEGPGDGPMEGPGGMGGPGGGMGGPGGGMGGPGGGMGGPGGGMGGPGGGPGGFGGSSGSSTGNGLLVVDQYYIDDTEAQLRKILKDERYEQYRAVHPAEEPYTKRSTSTGGWGGRGMMMGGGPGGPM